MGLPLLGIVAVVLLGFGVVRACRRGDRRTSSMGGDWDGFGDFSGDGPSADLHDAGHHDSGHHDSGGHDSGDGGHGGGD